MRVHGVCQAALGLGSQMKNMLLPAALPANGEVKSALSQVFFLDFLFHFYVLVPPANGDVKSARALSQGRWGHVTVAAGGGASGWT